MTTTTTTNHTNRTEEENLEALASYTGKGEDKKNFYGVIPPVLLRDKKNNHFRRSFDEVPTGLWKCIAWHNNKHECDVVVEETYESYEDAMSRARAIRMRRHEHPTNWSGGEKMSMTWGESEESGAYGYIITVRPVLARREVIPVEELSSVVTAEDRRNGY